MRVTITVDYTNIKTPLSAIHCIIAPHITEIEQFFCDVTIEKRILRLICGFLYLSFVSYTPTQQIHGCDKQRVGYVVEDEFKIPIEVIGEEALNFILLNLIKIRNILQCCFSQAVIANFNNSVLTDVEVQDTAVVNLKLLVLTFEDIV